MRRKPQFGHGFFSDWYKREHVGVRQLVFSPSQDVYGKVGDCLLCDATGVPLLGIDSSGGEYGAEWVCQDCANELFDEVRKLWVKE